MDTISEKKNTKISKTECRKLPADDLDKVSGGTLDDADAEGLKINTSSRPDNKNESVNVINGKKQKL